MVGCKRKVNRINIFYFTKIHSLNLGLYQSFVKNLNWMLSCSVGSIQNLLPATGTGSRNNCSAICISDFG